MSSAARAAIPGSEAKHQTGFTAVPLDQQITVTIVLTHQAQSDPSWIAAIEQFAKDHSLTLTQADAVSRSVKVTGSLADFQNAFAVKFGMYEGHRSYANAVTVPAELAPYILAVLGLDNRPVARPRAAGSGQ